MVSLDSRLVGVDIVLVGTVGTSGMFITSILNNFWFGSDSGVGSIFNSSTSSHFPIGQAPFLGENTLAFNAQPQTVHL
jgi:hypothetical protein